MKTKWDIERKEKTTKEDDYHEITFKDYRGEYTIKIDNLRHFIEDCDRKANWQELKSS